MSASMRHLIVRLFSPIASPCCVVEADVVIFRHGKMRVETSTYVNNLSGLVLPVLVNKKTTIPCIQTW